ncbi:MAG: hypothetical protein K9I26_07705 [Flavobacterium sp.]|nr:hypothetical protein [Flavobacterium sp.]
MNIPTSIRLFDKEISYSKSIKLGKLVYKKGIGEKLNRIILYIIAFQLFLASVFILLDNNVPKTFFNVISLSVAILFSLYYNYRIYREKKLSKIQTTNEAKKNHILIQDYASNNNYTIYHNSSNTIVLKSSFISTMYIFLFISKQEINFVILKEGFKLDPPVLFSHIRFKRSLKKHLA